MEYLGIKIAGIGVILVGVWYLYEHYKSKLPSAVQTVVAEGVDALAAEAQSLITKLEDFVKNETEKLTGQVEQQTNINNAIAKTQAEITKAQELATKVKSIL